MTAYVEDVWYVLVENQSYGPYSAAHMANFVHEGRVKITIQLLTIQNRNRKSIKKISF